MHKKDKLHWIVEVTKLWDKVAWWVIFNNCFLEESVVGTVDGKKGLKSSCLNWKPTHLLDSKHNNCAAFVK
jgi:hypothetical protein